MQEFSSEIEDVLSGEVTIDRFYLRELQQQSPRTRRNVLSEDQLSSLLLLEKPEGFQADKETVAFVQSAINTGHHMMLLQSECDRCQLLMRGLMNVAELIRDDHLKRLVMFEISKVQALAFYKDSKYAAAVKKLSGAIHECPSIDGSLMEGLADALVILSESYSALGRREDALQSARLAVNVAHERLEKTKRRTKEREVFSGFRLQPVPSLVLTYRLLASELEKSGLGHLSSEWYERSYAVALKFGMHVDVLNELQKLLELSKSLLPSSRARSQDALKDVDRYADSGNGSSNSGREVKAKNVASEEFSGRESPTNASKTRPKSALPVLSRARNGEYEDTQSHGELSRGGLELIDPVGPDSDQHHRPKSALSKLGGGYAIAHRPVPTVASSAEAPRHSSIPSACRPGRDQTSHSVASVFAEGSEQAFEIAKTNADSKGIAVPAQKKKSKGHSIILIPPLAPADNAAPSSSRPKISSVNSKAQTAPRPAIAEESPRDDGESKKPKTAIATKRSSRPPKHDDKAPDVTAKKPTTPQLPTQSKQNKTLLSRTMRRGPENLNPPAAESSSPMQEYILSLDEFGKSKVKRITDFYLPYFKGLRVEAKYQQQRLGERSRWYPGRIVELDFLRGIYDVEFENGDVEKGIFVDSIRLPKTEVKQLNSQAHQVIHNFNRTKKEMEQGDVSKPKPGATDIFASVIRGQNMGAMHNQMMKILGGINKRAELRKVERVAVKNKLVARIQALMRGVLLRKRFTKLRDQVLREKQLIYASKELRLKEEELRRTIQRVGNLPIMESAATQTEENNLVTSAVRETNPPPVQISSTDNKPIAAPTTILKDSFLEDMGEGSGFRLIEDSSSVPQASPEQLGRPTFEGMSMQILRQQLHEELQERLQWQLEQQVEQYVTKELEQQHLRQQADLQQYFEQYTRLQDQLKEQQKVLHKYAGRQKQLHQHEEQLVQIVNQHELNQKHLQIQLEELVGRQQQMQQRQFQMEQVMEVIKQSIVDSSAATERLLDDHLQEQSRQHAEQMRLLLNQHQEHNVQQQHALQQQQQVVQRLQQDQKQQSLAVHQIPAPTLDIPQIIQQVFQSEAMQQQLEAYRSLEQAMQIIADEQRIITAREDQLQLEVRNHLIRLQEDIAVQQEKVNDLAASQAEGRELLLQEMEAIVSKLAPVPAAAIGGAEETWDDPALPDTSKSSSAQKTSGSLLRAEFSEHSSSSGPQNIEGASVSDFFETVDLHRQELVLEMLSQTQSPGEDAEEGRENVEELPANLERYMSSHGFQADELEGVLSSNSTPAQQSSLELSAQEDLQMLVPFTVQDPDLEERRDLLPTSDGLGAEKLMARSLLDIASVLAEEEVLLRGAEQEEEIEAPQHFAFNSVSGTPVSEPVVPRLQRVHSAPQIVVGSNLDEQRHSPAPAATTSNPFAVDSERRSPHNEEESLALSNGADFESQLVEGGALDQLPHASSSGEKRSQVAISASSEVKPSPQASASVSMIYADADDDDLLNPTFSSMMEGSQILLEAADLLEQQAEVVSPLIDEYQDLMMQIPDDIIRGERDDNEEELHLQNAEYSDMVMPLFIESEIGEVNQDVVNNSAEDITIVPAQDKQTSVGEDRVEAEEKLPSANADEMAEELAQETIVSMVSLDADKRRGLQQEIEDLVQRLPALQTTAISFRTSASYNVSLELAEEDIAVQDRVADNNDLLSIFLVPEDCDVDDYIELQVRRADDDIEDDKAVYTAKFQLQDLIGESEQNWRPLSDIHTPRNLSLSTQLLVRSSTLDFRQVSLAVLRLWENCVNSSLQQLLVDAAVLQTSSRALHHLRESGKVPSRFCLQTLQAGKLLLSQAQQQLDEGRNALRHLLGDWELYPLRKQLRPLPTRQSKANKGLPDLVLLQQFQQETRSLVNFLSRHTLHDEYEYGKLVNPSVDDPTFLRRKVGEAWPAWAPAWMQAIRKALKDFFTAVGIRDPLQSRPQFMTTVTACCLRVAEGRGKQLEDYDWCSYWQHRAYLADILKSGDCSELLYEAQMAMLHGDPQDASGAQSFLDMLYKLSQ